ncbi:MAG: DAK2 domain-containing protein [Clostridia bacterium]|nr:DAK2 domain-containing protein [Clostridia bacterium]
MVMRRMLIAGGKNIEVNRAQIDALNVFPVPDGDTGINMSLTMNSVIAGLNADNSTKMDILADIVSKCALKGARGNSGVILSQILKGFSIVIADKEDIDTRTFAQALKNGTELAYSAVSKPKEGTMLTVVRVVSDKALDICRYVGDFEDFLVKLIQCGEDILAQTPDMLDVLKKAGVVDSGGYGLVTLFKGMLAGFKNEEKDGAESGATQQNTMIVESKGFDDGVFIDYHSLDDIEFAYCTEFFVINLYKKTTLTNIDQMREYFCQIGDSVVVVGDLDMVKVHVHSNSPGLVLTHALKLGEIDRVKIENMLKQNRILKAKLEAERKNVGVLSVCSGEGFNSIFKDLLVDQVLSGGQTMNPSAEDIANAIKKINASNVIVLPNNKNIILAAEQSRALIENKDIYVINTKDIPMGIAAMLAYNAELPLPEILAEMNTAIKDYRSGSVTYAVRNSSVDTLKLKQGDKIGIDRNKIVCKGTKVNEVAMDLIDRLIRSDDEIVTLYYGADVTETEATELQQTLQDKYPDCEICMFYGGQPLYYYLFSIE